MKSIHSILIRTTFKELEDDIKKLLVVARKMRRRDQSSLFSSVALVVRVAHPLALRGVRRRHRLRSEAWEGPRPTLSRFVDRGKSRNFNTSGSSEVTHIKKSKKREFYLLEFQEGRKRRGLPDKKCHGARGYAFGTASAQRHCRYSNCFLFSVAALLVFGRL